MSIRLRLTLLYTALLALTLLGFGAILYGSQARLTLRDEVQLVAGVAQQIVELRQAGFPLDERMLREQPLPSFRMGGPGRWRRFGAPRMYVQLLDPGGEVSSHSESLADVHLPLSRRGLNALRSGRPWVETAFIEEERLLIYSAPVIRDGRLAEIVQVASSLSNRDLHLGFLGTNLLIISGGVVVIAFGAGWVLAGAVLRPIHRLTQTAQAIGAERDFGRRVDHSGPNDEIGQLAATFNTMLGQLQTAYQQVEQALQRQRQFVADVSHELRTPLTTLRGNLALLRREPAIGPEEQEDILRDMVDESDRLIRLLNNLLMLARAEAGRQLRREPVALQPLLADACRRARRLGPQREIECESPPDVVALGDEDALKQVVWILLDNALTHTSGAIAVTAAADSPRGVTICVRDHGPGIPPEALPHLFERFYRGEAARGRPGVGLGLPIARALVEAQDGRITIESQPGQGSVVRVTLPAG